MDLPAPGRRRIDAHPFVLLVVGFLFLSVPAACQWQSIGAIDHVVTRDAHSLTVASGPALLAVRFLNDDVVRIRCSVQGGFGPDRSMAVIDTVEHPVTVSIAESDQELVLTSKGLVVHLRKAPLRVTVTDAAGNILSADDPARGISWSGTEVRVWKQKPLEEDYYGFGEKAGALLRNDTHMTMWNSDIPAYGSDTDPLYQTIPFFYAIRNGRASGTFFDNTYRSSFDMGKESRDAYSFGAENGEMNYYVIAGPAPRDVVARFTTLTGRMPLPPLWSLGYQQCRWSYAPERRLREIAQGFRSRSIPCDVLYLDIDYMDGYRIFTWNTTGFPHPRRLTDDLRRDGFTLAVIVDPGIKADSAYHAFRSGLKESVFVRTPKGELFLGKVWPGVCAFPDFSKPAARDWWGRQFSVLLDSGVRGWWNDMNEPSVFDVPTKTIDLDAIHDDGGLHTTHAKNHNTYGLQMTRATYEGVTRLLPTERPFVLTRASYAGGWRYSAAWTGDNVSSWEHLGLAASMCLGLSISGQPFVGSDIGGFIGYPSGELFARWLQLGVFTPLMRAHSVINEKNKEPWEYGDTFTAINRKTIGLRYQFLPYIYTAMEAASRTGIPAMRPPIFDYPADRRFEKTSEEFLFGNDLLVAPVLMPEVTSKSVTIPEGTWCDYWSDTVITGPSSIDAPAPIDRLPLFIRGGAILPTRTIVQSTREAPITPLLLTAFPDPAHATHVSEYYEDDGQSFAYRDGAYLRRSLTQTWNGASRIIRMGNAEGTYTPVARTVVVEVRGVQALPGGVTRNGVALQKTEEAGKEGWRYDARTKTATLVVTDTREAVELAITP